MLTMPTCPNSLARALVLGGLLAAPVLAQNLGAAFSATADGYIEVPYSPQVVPASGITFEAWITYDDASLPTGWRYPTIGRQGISVNGSEDWFLRVNAGNTGARVLLWKVITATGQQLNCNWTFAPGQLTTWTHVAGTYDGTTSALYVNGAQVASVAGTGQPIRDINNEVLRIGKGSDVATPIEVWNGQIDEVRLWPFARSAAEILATMNQELIGVPGLVATWNLNGAAVDTSSTLHGTTSGSVTFTPNSLALTNPVLPVAGGTSTPGCLGALAISCGSAAQVGNAAYSLACTRTPPSSIAVFGVSAGVLPGSFPLLGVDVWLDPTGLITATAQANALGVLRLPIAIPAGAPIGFAFGAQVLVLDPCGSQGFTASNALLTTVQP
jgi:hypothetical protein